MDADSVHAFRQFVSARSYQDLRVWRDAMRLARLCYDETRDFPEAERFGLTSQIRRASASVPANIAEGNGRFSPRDYLRFLSMANGSLRELDSHIMLAHAVGLMNAESEHRCLALAATTGRRLRALADALRSGLA